MEAVPGPLPLNRYVKTRKITASVDCIIPIASEQPRRLHVQIRRLRALRLQKRCLHAFKACTYYISGPGLTPNLPDCSMLILFEAPTDYCDALITLLEGLQPIV